MIFFGYEIKGVYSKFETTDQHLEALFCILCDNDLVKTSTITLDFIVLTRFQELQLVKAFCVKA